MRQYIRRNISLFPMEGRVEWRHIKNASILPPSGKNYVISLERISLVHNVVLELSFFAIGIASSFLFGIASKDFLHYSLVTSPLHWMVCYCISPEVTIAFVDRFLFQLCSDNMCLTWSTRTYKLKEFLTYRIYNITYIPLYISCEFFGTFHLIWISIYFVYFIFVFQSLTSVNFRF